MEACLQSYKDYKEVKVSIIIPCYNLGAYVKDAVESVRAQTYSDYEIIIVDDGSTDPKTIKVLEGLSRNQVQVLRTKNKKLPGARNHGISQASGEYMMCLDADDMLAPTYLEKTVKVLDQDKEKNLAFVTTWLQEFGERSDVWRAGEFNIPQLLMNNIVQAGSLFRKSVWKEVGGYKDEMVGGYEDWEFWLSTVEKGYKWAVVPEPLFLYRIRGESMLHSPGFPHLDLYTKLYDFHEKLFLNNLREFVLANTEDEKVLRQAVKAKDESIAELEVSKEEYEEEVISLRQQVFKLRDEIGSMRNSRVLGKIIKLREFIGEARKTKVPLPRNGAHRIRVVVAPFIPGPIRRAIKRSLKPKVVTKTQSNEEWGSNSPIVSVVIPHYNRADTIDETLDSLMSQTFKNFEVIIVDDGSTDEVSAEKLKNLGVKKLNVKVIKQENQGVAAARNNGISHARGKYIVCLDSDDALEPTYIEKATIVLETSPDASLVTAHMQTFGVTSEVYKHIDYDPLQITRNNMVITAAEFKKQAWETSGGYKSGIGYEDWEFWVNLAEHGFWGKLIPETLFKYRTSMQSRYVDDKDGHWTNMKNIRLYHAKYAQRVKKLLSKRRSTKNIIDSKTAFINLDDRKSYHVPDNGKGNILIIVPWLTFGGAETLILNFCREVKDNFNLSFVTGLDSEHEWEHKFKEITQDIYHLTNLFEDKALYVEFISNYIKTRSIDAIHIIHTDYAFEMLAELKKRHPSLKVVVTLFNDRAAHFGESLQVKEYIDVFTTDNQSVYKHYHQELGDEADIRVIPNGINSNDVFNPALFDRKKERAELGLSDEDLAVFFVGRISEEKNPDVFLKAAKAVVAESQNVKFFVIGSGVMTKEVERIVSAINHPNVQYLGYQSDIARYLSMADIFVLPSSIEGFPLSILEAMAMRVVVVASDVGAVPEIVSSGEDGFIVAPGSATEIATTINMLRDNPKLMAAVKSKAREKVDKKYSNVILGENYKKLYGDYTK